MTFDKIQLQTQQPFEFIDLIICDQPNLVIDSGVRSSLDKWFTRNIKNQLRNRKKCIGSSGYLFSEDEKDAMKAEKDSLAEKLDATKRPA